MRQGQPALGVISDVGIPSLFIEKASLPTQRSGRCSSGWWSPVGSRTCLRPTSWTDSGDNIWTSNAAPASHDSPLPPPHSSHHPTPARLSKNSTHIASSRPGTTPSDPPPHPPDPSCPLSLSTPFPTSCPLSLPTYISLSLSYLTLMSSV